MTIRSWPAIHSLDGPVSFGLEWNGFKFVFGGDTYPNKWFDEYAKDADLAIHECFITVPDMITKFKFTPQSALAVGTQIHTAPEAFGKVMSRIKPRRSSSGDTALPPALRRRSCKRPRRQHIYLLPIPVPHTTHRRAVAPDYDTFATGRNCRGEA